MNIPVLKKRLAAAAELVREGCFLSDVGTDHAYLPVSLFVRGRIRGAVASDIGEGPLSAARRHILEFDAARGVTPVLTGGLDGIEAFAPDDIAILGMGGELIVSILSDAPWVKNEGIHLVLQPMTKQAEVRTYLWENGFRIDKEVLSRDDGKIYQILSVYYDGQKRTGTLLEAAVGAFRRDALLCPLLVREKGILYDVVKGKEKAGLSTDTEKAMLTEIEAWLEELR